MVGMKLCRQLLDGSIGKREAATWLHMVREVETTLGRVGGGSEQLTTQGMLVPRVLCQRFRNGQPITCDLLFACFDPKANKKLRNNTLQPHHLLVRTAELQNYRSALIPSESIV